MKSKRWVVSLESDPNLPAGVKIGYYEGSRFYCNCGSNIVERGINIHFETQRHQRWVQCQNKLLKCKGGSCDSSMVMSPRSPAKSPK